MPTPLIVPTSGSIYGGDSFLISSISLSNAAYADSFTSGSLDAKWTNICSGGGSLSTGAGLQLDVTTAGGVAGIQTVDLYNNFDVAAKFTYDRSIQNLYPDAVIEFFRLTARMDASNYFSLLYAWDPSRGLIIQVIIVVDAVSRELYSTSTLGSEQVLRLVRYGGRILAYAGSVLLYDFRGWTTSSVNIELATSSAGTPLPLRTIVSNYTPSLVVTFNEEIAPLVFNRADRVGGMTPVMKLPTSAQVVVYSISSSTSIDETFSYVPPQQLTVSRNNNAIVVSNDDTLRDSGTDLKGLRL